MSTHIAIHFQTEKTIELIDAFERYLRRTNRHSQISRVTSDAINGIYGKSFINSNSAPPTTFAIAREQPDWTTVHYNSFFEYRDLPAEVSMKFNCLAVLVMAQSVSGAYYISVHSSGEHLRTLEFGDGEWLKLWGKPLPFEKAPLGHNIGSDSGPFYIFDDDDLGLYCGSLGLNLWNLGVESEYTILRTSLPSEPSNGN